MKPIGWLAGAGALAALAGLAVWDPLHWRGGAMADTAAAATPPGVTLTVLGNPEKRDGADHLLVIREFSVNGATVFSDPRGMTYYVYDKDKTPGRSACAGECLKFWKPATAPDGAGEAGDWTIISGPGGARQWAHQGKPLYTFAKDRIPGDAFGDKLDGEAWHPAVFKPGSTLTQLIGHSVFKPTLAGPHPANITLAEVETAGGQILVDELGRSLYAFDGKAEDDGLDCGGKGPCKPALWAPVEAPMLAGDKTIGDFTIVTRRDGKPQWAFRGAPLYRYVADEEAGTAGGIGVDDRWNVALVVRYPVPKSVSVQDTTADGRIFATADGRSLYRQHIFYYGFGHDFQHGTQYFETIGRLIGPRGCDQQCLKQFHPFLATDDEQPSGHWTIVKRPDGGRQWAYKGYSLYTFGEDKKPGDLFGRDIWDVSWNDPSLKKVSLLTRLNINAETVSGVFWATVYL